jgi:hypothetical protein
MAQLAGGACNIDAVTATTLASGSGPFASEFVATNLVHQHLT